MPASPAETAPPDFRFFFSDGLADFLTRTGISLLVTTYQAGKLMAVRAREGRVSTLLRSMDQPMGLALDGSRLAVGTRNGVWFFRNAADIAPQIEPPGTHDACWIPRACHVTGNVRGHEMAFAGSDLWIVNTRFSCLCTLHADYSFVPRWRPSFISALAAEDRCHLNGLAMQGGRPRFATALGESDAPEGWRPTKASGGVLIDVPTGAVVTRGFSMPHSPRLYGPHVLVLDSGRGELAAVDPATGERNTIAAFPGYTRGLAVFDHFAMVGLSRIREKKEFGGLPIEERQRDLKCGVYIVDLVTGAHLGCLEFERGCEEIFAVEVMPAVRWPELVGFKEDTIDNVFVVPPR
jgi:uncharacterized protein (TIGR03032 family)